MREIVDKDAGRIKTLLQKVFADAEYAELKRLTGGMTNRSYKITRNDGSAFVVRIPGEGTEKMINRADEKKSNELACQLNIDCSLIYFDGEGNKVMAFIDHEESLDEKLMREPAIIDKAAEIFHCLHHSGADTGVLFDIFAMAQTYENIIKENHVQLFPDYDLVKMQVMKIKQDETESGIGALVPCHNDPLPGNWILDKTGKLWLIDWEYAGMNDFMWDLSCMSLECEYTDKEDSALLTAYFSREAAAVEKQHFIAEKVYIDYLWSLWGLTRVPYSKAMQEYADGRYQRLKQNLRKY